MGKIFLGDDGRPISFTDTDGKTTFISAYDAEDYYNPLLIELDDYGKRVRVYTAV